MGPPRESQQGDEEVSQKNQLPMNTDTTKKNGPYGQNSDPI